MKIDNDTPKEKKFTTSKKILWATYILFVSQIVFAMYAVMHTMDTSICCYTVPATAGLAGATTMFYMNKSKMENVFRFKISFLKFKLKVTSENPDKTEVIENELSPVEQALDMKIDSTMNEAVNEDISVQNY